MEASLRASAVDVRELPLNIGYVRQLLKREFTGSKVLDALRFRLETHLSDPMQDPLSAQVWAAYLELPKKIKTPCTILDAGCMSGFLYHHLKRHLTDFTYVGVDRWEEALEVGREFAPEVEFIHGDIENGYFGQFDYVVCSNIPWQTGDRKKAFDNLYRQTRRALFFIHPGNVIETLERTTANTPDA